MSFIFIAIYIAFTNLLSPNHPRLNEMDWSEAILILFIVLGIAFDLLTLAAKTLRAYDKHQERKLQ